MKCEAQIFNGVPGTTGLPSGDGRRPCSRMSIQSCYFYVLDVEML